jgi:hypothetical protein
MHKRTLVAIAKGDLNVLEGIVPSGGICTEPSFLPRSSAG